MHTTSFSGSAQESLYGYPSVNTLAIATLLRTTHDALYDLIPEPNAVTARNTRTMLGRYIESLKGEPADENALPLPLEYVA